MGTNENNKLPVLAKKLWQNRCACYVISELIDRTAEEQGFIDAHQMERLNGMSYLLNLVGDSIEVVYAVLNEESLAG